MMGHLKLTIFIKYLLW